MNGVFERERVPGIPSASSFVILATLFVVACGGDGPESGGEIDRGLEAETPESGRVDSSQILAGEDPTEGDPAAESDDDDLGSALAAARDVEIPEAEIRPEFERIETVHELLETRGFIEIIEATARRRSGATYRLNMRLVHRAGEPAHHMTAVVEQTGGQTDQVRQLVEMSPYSRMSLGMAMRAGGEFEQIRIGERYWERQAEEEWLSATELPPETPVFGTQPPVARLTKRFDEPHIVTATQEQIGEEILEKRTTRHVRIEGIGTFRSLWSALALPGAPPVPADTPAGGGPGTPGTSDVWLTDSGVVVRAELRLATEHGHLYEATLELTEFGEQPEIQPPN